MFQPWEPPYPRLSYRCSKKIQLPWIANHVEIELRRLHEPGKLLDANPAAHRALLEGCGDHPSAHGWRGHRAFAPAALPLDGVDAIEFVEQRALQPALPEFFQGSRRRCAQRGVPRLGQRDFSSLRFDESGGLHQQWPNESSDRSDNLMPSLLFVRDGVEKVAFQQIVGDQSHRGGGGLRCFRAHGDTAAINQSQDGE